MTASTGPGENVVVVNPESGSGDHATQVSMLADEHGFEVLESGAPGEAVTLAERAAPEASVVAACGGDGTVNEVVRGVLRAGALDGTTVGVVPVGTGNNFAEKIGVESIAQSFDVLAEGETRRIDLGIATATPRSTPSSTSTAGDDPGRDTRVRNDSGRNDPRRDDARPDDTRPDDAEQSPGGRPVLDDGTRPFVNSCVCGITAEASVSTSHDQKDRLGTLAYVVNTLQEAQEFDPLPIHVETHDGTSSTAASTTGASDGTASANVTGSVADTVVEDSDEEGPLAGSGRVRSGETTWSGEAVAVLVGNGRRFPASGTAQANMEDGLFDVTIIEDRPTIDLVGEEARRRLLDAEGDHITRLRTSGLTLSVRRSDPTAFSLDGEMLEAGRLEIALVPGCLDLRVGAGYEPDPDH